MVALYTAMCVYFPPFTLLPCACLEIALFRPLDQSVCRRPMDPARDFCSGPACSAHSARAVESVPGAAAAVTRVRIRSILFVLMSWEGLKYSGKKAHFFFFFFKGKVL